MNPRFPALRQASAQSSGACCHCSPRIYRPFPWLVVLACLFYACSPGSGSEPAPIKDWLAKPVVPPELAHQELVRYLEARIPRLSPISDRQAWEQESNRLRQEMLAKVIYRGEAVAWRDASLGVDWQAVIHGDEDYRIKKLRFEALPGLWVPALLYEPLRGNGKVAVGLNINGHDAAGKAADYKQIRCINQAKRGMLSLNVEWLGMGQLRTPEYAHGQMNQLDLCGTSGLAPFYLVMKRALDVLLDHPRADASRVAVAGLSGGGWQTIFISSLDTRVTLANPVAGYSSFLTRIHHHSDLGDSEQTPCDMATVGDYTHLTAILAPRATLLTYNSKDNCCFASDHALPPLLEAAQPAFRVFDQESKLRSHVNHDPGDHNFQRDNREAFYRVLLQEKFFAEGTNATEIEVARQVLNADQLRVELPAGNATLNSLAAKLMQKLPRQSQLPLTREAAVAWQQRGREQVRQLLAIRDLSLTSEAAGTAEAAGVTGAWWRLHLSDQSTVPAVEITPANPRGTTLVCGEEGRTKLAELVGDLVGQGQRVVAIDPFYWGELHPASRDYLWALLVQTIGDRPAGRQASQLAAVARWLREKHGGQPIRLVMRGPRATLAALAAAAVESQAIGAVELHAGQASLKELIEQKTSYEQKPELFCFGLLEQFDLVQLAALSAPRPVELVSPTPRQRAEFGPLVQWKQLWKLPTP